MLARLNHHDVDFLRGTRNLARGSVTGVAAEHYRLLVTEDEADIRRAVGAALRDQKPSIIEAATGTAAIDALNDSPPDPIILDLYPPDTDRLPGCDPTSAM